MVSTAAPLAAIRAGTRRVAFLDNSKFLAVTLVVIGHAIQRLTPDSDSAFTLYVVIYAFHIPVFALLSGYFSRSEPPGLRSMMRTVTDLLIPYLVMETAWSTLTFAIHGSFSFDPTRPFWTLWFLLSLVTFRVILPYLALLRWPLVISLFISVGSGYLSEIGHTFTLARTLGLLPFFVLGWKLSSTSLVGWWLSLGRRVWWVRAGALTVLMSVLVIVYTHSDGVRTLDPTHWLFYDQSYAKMGADSVNAGGTRLALLAAAIILGTAFLSLIPRRETFFTSMGKATMYVYLLHTFVLYPLRESGILGTGSSSALWLVPLIFCSVALSCFLASEPVQRLFRPVLSPRSDWLFRKGVTENEDSLRRVSPRIDRMSQDS